MNGNKQTRQPLTVEGRSMIRSDAFICHFTDFAVKPRAKQTDFIGNCFALNSLQLSLKSTSIRHCYGFMKSFFSPEFPLYAHFQHNH